MKDKSFLILKHLMVFIGIILLIPIGIYAEHWILVLWGWLSAAWEWFWTMCSKSERIAWAKPHALFLFIFALGSIFLHHYAAKLCEKWKTKA